MTVTRATRKAIAVGSLSSVLGTLLMLGSFYGFLRIAERWSGARLSTDSLAGIWQNTPISVLISALGGFLFAWFAFGFIITYSQLSSRDELRDLDQR
jgi:hypothetical protein